MTTPINQNSPSIPDTDPQTDDGNIEGCIESIADSLEILAAVAVTFATHAGLDVKKAIEELRATSPI